jgi:hypothetical protein
MHSRIMKVRTKDKTKMNEKASDAARGNGSGQKTLDVETIPSME